MLFLRKICLKAKVQIFSGYIDEEGFKLRISVEKIESDWCRAFNLFNAKCF